MSSSHPDFIRPSSTKLEWSTPTLLHAALHQKSRGDLARCFAFVVPVYFAALPLLWLAIGHLIPQSERSRLLFGSIAGILVFLLPLWIISLFPGKPRRYHLTTNGIRSSENALPLQWKRFAAFDIEELDTPIPHRRLVLIRHSLTFPHFIILPDTPQSDEIIAAISTHLPRTQVPYTQRCKSPPSPWQWTLSLPPSVLYACLIGHFGAPHVRSFFRTNGDLAAVLVFFLATTAGPALLFALYFRWRSSSFHATIFLMGHALLVAMLSLLAALLTLARSW